MTGEGRRTCVQEKHPQQQNPIPFCRGEQCVAGSCIRLQTEDLQRMDPRVRAGLCLLPLSRCDSGTHRTGRAETSTGKSHLHFRVYSVFCSTEVPRPGCRAFAEGMPRALRQRFFTSVCALCPGAGADEAWGLVTAREQLPDWYSGHGGTPRLSGTAAVIAGCSARCLFNISLQ